MLHVGAPQQASNLKNTRHTTSLHAAKQQGTTRLASQALLKLMYSGPAGLALQNKVLEQFPLDGTQVNKSVAKTRKGQQSPPNCSSLGNDLSGPPLISLLDKLPLQLIFFLPTPSFSICSQTGHQQPNNHIDPNNGNPETTAATPTTSIHS